MSSENQLNKEAALEPIVKLLFFGMVFWTVMLFVCVQFYSQDGQTFQVISGLLTGFSGAFFMRIKPRGVMISEKSDPPKDTDKTISIG